MSPMPSARTARPLDLPALTSLRFVAAAMIVYRHVQDFFPALATDTPLVLVHGVSFFFVLSGFILTHAHLGRPAGWSGFMGRRLARIAPTHLAAMALLLVLPADQVFDQVVAPSARAWATAGKLFLLDSWSPNLQAAFVLNRPSWSLSTEMAFYAAFPLLLGPVARRPFAMTIAALGVAAVALIGLAATRMIDVPRIDAQPNLFAIAYMNPLVRGAEFVLGISLAILWTGSIRGLGGSALGWTIAEVAALLATLGWLTIGFPLTADLVPAVFAHWFDFAGSAPMFGVLILVMASGRGAVGRALGLPVFVWLGRVSFAIYITHFVMMKILWVYGGPHVPAAVIAGCVLAVGALAHHLVETPCQRWLLRRAGRERTAMAGKAHAYPTPAAGAV